jgi:uncharacterized integral membrane protein
MRIVWLLVGALATLFLVTLSVANRHGVRLVLDPFNPQAPVLSTELPFYAYLFATLIAGVVIGGMATWLSQSRWRRTARTRSQEVLRWKAEAERLSRERDADFAREAGAAAPRKQLALVSRR